MSLVVVLVALSVIVAVALVVTGVVVLVKAIRRHRTRESPTAVARHHD